MDSIFERVLTPMVQLNLNELEFTYLLCQLCFHVEGREWEEILQIIPK